MPYSNDLYELPADSYLTPYENNEPFFTSYENDALFAELESYRPLESPKLFTQSFATSSPRLFTNPSFDSPKLQHTFSSFNPSTKRAFEHEYPASPSTGSDGSFNSSFPTAFSTTEEDPFELSFTRMLQDAIKQAENDAPTFVNPAMLQAPTSYVELPAEPAPKRPRLRSTMTSPAGLNPPLLELHGDSRPTFTRTTSSESLPAQLKPILPPTFYSHPESPPTTNTQPTLTTHIPLPAPIQPQEVQRPQIYRSRTTPVLPAELPAEDKQDKPPTIRSTTTSRRSSIASVASDATTTSVDPRQRSRAAAKLAREAAKAHVELGWKVYTANVKLLGRMRDGIALRRWRAEVRRYWPAEGSSTSGLEGESASDVDVDDGQSDGDDDGEDELW
ncbi:hypothetical protein BJ508DRAFT_366953 [Ascobolus immersus RN42]|uniref:Uncharacterized protein n=1 Tax=Ascobolus immersus RN42 TaxID=1160509 RepID=A0A3N4HFM9_ASCIM|nr:hypothetical protein BJ508DRAFT_366953 [Ascobolus immersus RN42]